MLERRCYWGHVVSCSGFSTWPCWTFQNWWASKSPAHWVVVFCCRGLRPRGESRWDPTWDSSSREKLCPNQCVPVRRALAEPAAWYFLSTGRYQWTGVQRGGSTNVRDLATGSGRCCIRLIDYEKKIRAAMSSFVASTRTCKINEISAANVCLVRKEK